MEDLRINGFGAASLLEEMTAALQRMAVAQAVPGMPADPDPDAQQVERLAALLPPDETQLLYSLCLHGRGELGLAPDEYAALTMVLLRLLAFKPGGAEKKTSTHPTRWPAMPSPRRRRCRLPRRQRWRLCLTWRPKTWPHSGLTR